MEKYSLFAVGATYDGKDVSQDFIANNVIGVGWSATEAPELKFFVEHMAIGDVVYIKSCNFNSNIRVKAIGRIVDDKILVNFPINKVDVITFGRNVEWLYTEPFSIDKPREKNNVRSNALYQEFHPEVTKVIDSKIS